MRALVERFDADRGARRLESLVSAPLPPAPGRQRIEGAKAQVLQAFTGGQHPVVVPAGQQLGGVQYGDGGVLGLRAPEVRVVADQQLRAVQEPVDIDHHLVGQREPRVADIEQRRYADMAVPQSPQDRPKAGGRDLVGAVRPQHGGRVGPGTAAVEGQERNEVLRTGGQLDLRH